MLEASYPVIWHHILEGLSFCYESWASLNYCYVIIFRATVMGLSHSNQQVLLCLYTFSCLVLSWCLIVHTINSHVQMIFWTLNICCIQILSAFQTSFSLIMRSCVAKYQTTTWPQVTDDLIFIFTAVITLNSKYIICKFVTKYYRTFSLAWFFWFYCSPGVDSASNRNGYQKYLLWVEAASA